MDNWDRSCIGLMVCLLAVCIIAQEQHIQMLEREMRRYGLVHDQVDAVTEG